LEDHLVILLAAAELELVETGLAVLAEMGGCTILLGRQFIMQEGAVVDQELPALSLQAAQVAVAPVEETKMEILLHPIQAAAVAAAVETSTLGAQAAPAQ
jgi:hypothetical protein